MPSKYRRILLVFLIVFICVYQRLFWTKIPSTSHGIIPIPGRNLSHEKISIAYYTTLYGIRTDSHSKKFNANLQSICQMLDPEDYSLADSVLVSLVDLKHLPDISYRMSHPAQLWIVYSEESPRNSYRTMKLNEINKLDHWFNLTATLKPESDFHIQYRGYRIKPEIGELLQTKFNITLDRPRAILPEKISPSSSMHFNTLSSIFEKEFIDQQNHLIDLCPYTCNQPLPTDLIAILQSSLPAIPILTLSRKIVYIAWFVSNCNTHSRREDYVAQLRAQPNIHVDIYGDCQSIYHPPRLSIPCHKGIPNCTERILSQYRFYLSFENSLCNSYITEKYWIHGLNRHAVPIVLGAKREQYHRLAIPHSYLHVDDYPTIEDLARELHRLNTNDTEFIRYLQWTQFYDVSVDYQPHSIVDMHSALCLLGHYRYLHSINEQTRQIQSLMNSIRMIFNLTQIHLPNFNWSTARTKFVRWSEFYHPRTNCWDREFPSFFNKFRNYFFTWWKFY